MLKTACLVILCALFFTMLVACGGEKNRPVYVDTEVVDEDSAAEEEDVGEKTQTGSEEVLVPYRDENGVKLVQVKVNGVGFEMIFDTGCSGTLISMAEANYLYQKGKLTPDDVLGVTQAQIADGSIVENMVVNLKEVVINDQIQCPNVQATVSNNINAPLLLGNEVLNRIAAITIDQEREVLVFKMK